MNRFHLVCIAGLVTLSACPSPSGTDSGSCAPGTADCGCYPNGTCDANLTCNASSVCEACPARSEGCACATGACNSGLVCMANKCVKSGSCTPGDKDCSCASGDSCDAGLTCNAGLCLTCSNSQVGCACVAGACVGLLCDSTSSKCRAPFECGSTQVACALHERCNPSTASADATCAHICDTGYTYNSASSACDQIAGLSCSPDAGALSISAQCAGERKTCVESGNSAMCGTCVSGFILEQLACRAVKTCTDLGCAAGNKLCTPATATADAACGACLPGFMVQGSTCVANTSGTCAGGVSTQCATLHKLCVDRPTGAICQGCETGFPIDDTALGVCRLAFNCSTNPPTCMSGQSCVAGSPEDRCQTNCSLPCSAPGARGVWPTLVGGQCICETNEGYFFSLADLAPIACDADGDGWVRVSAKAAIEDGRADISINARCSSNLKRVDRFELENDRGEVLAVPVGVDGGLPLYETDQNDSPVDHNAAVPPFYPSQTLGRGLLASEINSLTKACVSAGLDLNGNVIDDAKEWGRAPSDQIPLSAALPLKNLFDVYTRFSYFIEMHRGWYLPPVGAQPFGSYRIREKPRLLASAGRVPFVYGQDADGGYASDFWMSCDRGQDRWYSTTLPATGLDFASVSTPAAGWSGMTSHGQFKCVVIDQSLYNSIQMQDAGALNRQIQSVASLQALNWQANSCRVAPASATNPPVTGTANPTEPPVTCASAPLGGLNGSVVWALAPIQEPTDYQRGCIKLCGGQRFLCPGVAPDGGPRPPCYDLCGDFAASEVKTLTGPAPGGGTYKLRGEVPYIPFAGTLGSPDGGLTIRPPPSKKL